MNLVFGARVNRCVLFKKEFSKNDLSLSKSVCLKQPWTNMTVGHGYMLFFALGRFANLY